MSDLIERLRRAHNDDHERGCDGRTYVCSCGYDHAIFAAADEAADRITALEKENAELRRTATTTNCCHCGRIIDKRETSQGGDPFGTQLTDRRWTCSFECWEAIVDPVKPSEAEGREATNDSP